MESSIEENLDLMNSLMGIADHIDIDNPDRVRAETLRQVEIDYRDGINKGFDPLISYK